MARACGFRTEKAFKINVPSAIVRSVASCCACSAWMPAMTAWEAAAGPTERRQGSRFARPAPPACGLDSAPMTRPFGCHAFMACSARLRSRGRRSARTEHCSVMWRALSPFRRKSSTAWWPSTSSNVFCSPNARGSSVGRPPSPEGTRRAPNHAYRRIAQACIRGRSQTQAAVRRHRKRERRSIRPDARGARHRAEIHPRPDQRRRRAGRGRAQSGRAEHHTAGADNLRQPGPQAHAD